MSKLLSIYNFTKTLIELFCMGATPRRHELQKKIAVQLRWVREASAI